MSSDSRPRGWRRLPLVVLSLLTLLILVIAGGVARVYIDARISTVGSTEFRNELAIPPLAPSRIDTEGTRVFELGMRPGRKEFIPGQTTQTWGFDGDYLGPTLRARRGEKVAVTVRNNLPEASTVHWHGMHLPAAMDGGPHQMVSPGTEWTPNWVIDQPAATLGITRIRTARPRPTCVAGWQACSCSMTTFPPRCPSPRSTVWTTFH
ncbi:multicopper oxidase domain-containing protein [Nocardia asteroides]